MGFYDLERASILFKRRRLRFPKGRFVGGECGLGRCGVIVGLRKDVADFRRVYFVEGLYENVLFGIVDDEEKRAGGSTEGVHSGDGVGSGKELHTQSVEKHRTFETRVRRDGKTEKDLSNEGQAC